VNYVYILECERDMLYTGYCTDIEKRLTQHFTGRGGAKFTRAFKPRRLAAVWGIDSDKGKAMKIEAFIKTLCRETKLDLTCNPRGLLDLMETSGKKDLADLIVDLAGDINILNEKIKA